MQIEDSNTGRVAGVDQQFQLKVVSESQELQHHNAWNSAQTYQVLSVDTGITAATQTLLHIINIDPTRRAVFTFIRAEAITDTANKPVAGEYFELGFGRTVASGGTVATPVNTVAGNGNIALVTATGIDPTMTGTFVPIDRKYNQSSASEWIMNKEGSIILDLNQTMELRFVSAGAGEAKCRFTFSMIDSDK